MFVELLVACRSDARELPEGATEPFLSRGETYLRKLKAEMPYAPLPLLNDPMLLTFGARTRAERLATRDAAAEEARAAAAAAAASAAATAAAAAHEMKAGSSFRKSSTDKSTSSLPSTRFLSPREEAQRSRASELLQRARSIVPPPGVDADDDMLSPAVTKAEAGDLAEEALKRARHPTTTAETQLHVAFSAERHHSPKDLARMKRVAEVITHQPPSRAEPRHFDYSGDELELLLYGRAGGFSEYRAKLASARQGVGTYLAEMHLPGHA